MVHIFTLFTESISLMVCQQTNLKWWSILLGQSRQFHQCRIYTCLLTTNIMRNCCTDNNLTWETFNNIPIKSSSYFSDTAWTPIINLFTHTCTSTSIYSSNSYLWHFKKGKEGELWKNVFKQFSYCVHIQYGQYQCITENKNKILSALTWSKP